MANSSRNAPSPDEFLAQLYASAPSQDASFPPLPGPGTTGAPGLPRGAAMSTTVTTKTKANPRPPLDAEGAIVRAAAGIKPKSSIDLVMEGIQNQKAGLSKLESQYGQANEDGQMNPWVGALMAVSDFVNGGKQFEGYTTRASQAKEKRLEKEAGLQKYREGISDKELELLKLQENKQSDEETRKMHLQIANRMASAKENGKGAPDLKDWQVQYANYGKRMEQAEGVFGSLEAGGYDRANRGDSLRSMLPGEMQGNNLKSQSQAEKNFLTAILRRESGASIAPTEFADGERVYFPRPGDTKETLIAKKAARKQAMESFKVGAGAAWDQIPAISAIGSGAPAGKAPASGGKPWEKKW